MSGRKCQRMIKVITFHFLENRKVCIRFHGNILLYSLDQSNQQTIPSSEMKDAFRQKMKQSYVFALPSLYLFTRPKQPVHQLNRCEL